jgi:hypothetical protein
LYFYFHFQDSGLFNDGTVFDTLSGFYRKPGGHHAMFQPGSQKGKLTLDY